MYESKKLFVIKIVRDGIFRMTNDSIQKETHKKMNDDESFKILNFWPNICKTKQYKNSSITMNYNTQNYNERY